MMKQRWGLDRNVLRTTPGDPWVSTQRTDRRNIETFQMDPTDEIKSQFAHYVLLDSHMLQMLKK